MRTLDVGLGGVRSVVQMNGDGSMTTGTIQDCDAILEDAQARHKEGHHGSGEMKHAGRIPFVVIERYCNDNGITFRECMGSQEHSRRILNSPELSAFRIWKGQV